MTSDSRERYHRLIKLIQQHNRAYYQDQAPLIPDDQYDSLMAELKYIESNHPDLVTPSSPSQQIGEVLNQNFKTVAHKVPMLSIDNTYSDDELIQFDTRIRKLLENNCKVSYICELKIDGVSLALRYKKGLLVQALTRGDGRYGDDVTNNAKQIINLPWELNLKNQNVPEDLEIRGEVYIQKKDFVVLNEGRQEAGLDIFVNPRNAAAGTLKLLDSTEVARRQLYFTAHGIGYSSDPSWFRSFGELYQKYITLGLPLVSNYHICKDIDVALMHSHRELKTRNNLPFDVDGMVVKVNEYEHHQILGFTAKSPRFMVAYKFPAERIRTQVLGIDFQVGRTGVVTPVANLTPVFIAGSTVSRATLHNFDEIKRLHLKIGDWVMIEKSGDIIPKIISTLPEDRNGTEKNIRQPKQCPVCGSELVRVLNEVAIRCLNSSCFSVLKAGLIHFASRKAMDIEGLGERVATQLLESQQVRSISDLYYLKVSDVIQLDRMADKSARNLIEAIHQSRSQGLARLIFGLGIPHVGEKIALVLAQKFKHISAIENASEEELLMVNEMGPIVSNSIYSFFRNPSNQLLIQKLSLVGVLMESKDSENLTSGPLAGQSVVVTGTLQKFTRDEIHVLIRRLGGNPTGSISKKTALLVAGAEAGSKLRKAKELNVRIISEQEFIQQYPMEVR